MRHFLFGLAVFLAVMVFLANIFAPKDIVIDGKKYCVPVVRTDD